MSNKVRIYSDLVIRKCLLKVVNQHTLLWEEDKFVKVSSDKWMIISLKKDWEKFIKEKVKVYSLDIKDKKVVD